MVTFTSIFQLGRVALGLIGQIGSRLYQNPNQAMDDLQASIDRLPNAMMRETAKANEASIADIRRDLMAYPSPRQTSRYERTYVLQHGWSDAPITTVDVFDGTLGTKVSNVTNTVPYAGWVQSRATQARWNWGRWKTVEEVVEAHSPSILDRVISALTIVSNGF